MSTDKNTPAPWAVSAGFAENGDAQYTLIGVKEIGWASARLISASPVLLDAIARLLREDADGHITIGCIEDAQAAFSLAGGVL